MTQELEPCPFCGGDAHIQWKSWPRSDARYAFITCKVCMASTAFHAEPRAAVKEWNTRALPRQEKWLPIEQYQSQHPLPVPVICHHYPTGRIYAPCRYSVMGFWEYWNEVTGVWERCGKQPTHFKSLLPLPNPPEVMT